MSAAPAAAPSGVVTFLFTDVEGSTRRWEADADGMRAALAAHDEVLRAAIESHGGWLFKHTGDGVCAAFASPRSAVDAAVAAQRVLELPVRMGLATGEAEPREADYFGAVLNRAARVMASGHGGQILLAESTASLLSDVEMVDLGPRRLRDLPTAVGLFQVCAPGLRADFPALRALDTSPGNLRPAVSSFVGRESELAEVQSAVKAHRLVTLIGVGGVGKTRLAIEVAAHMADEFPDGVWFFDLAAVADPAAVPDAVSAVLGVAQQAGHSVSESVAAALDGRIRLLVLDNCEHVRDAAADLVDTIRAQSSTVRILATSREGLGVADEQLWPVPSLDIGAGIDSGAVGLFVERARGVAPRFEMATPDDGAAVVEICRRLDGIPLAIELAAARMSSMTAGEVRDRLDHRFRLLIGSRRGLKRHQTLRYAVAWSYDHLDVAEKALLERCSVFTGGFDLESACAIAGFDEPDDFAVLDRLDALVRKSLLVADRSSGRTRYSMLETIREFAEEQLVAGGTANEARDAHARYFAGREADVMSLWDGPRQREAYAWYAAELANLRTAFRWATDHDDIETAAAMATYAPLLGGLFHGSEPIAWAEELIEPARAVGHSRLASLYAIASLCFLSGRIDEAVGYAEAAQTVIGSGGDDQVASYAEGLLAIVYMAIGRPERCVEFCRAQLARGRDVQRRTQASLVFALAFTGAADEARACSNGLIEAAEASGNPYALAVALQAVGVAFRDTEPVRALAALRRARAIAQGSNRITESIVAGIVCSLEAEHGEPLVAFDYLALAIRTFLDAGHTAMMRTPLAALAALFDRVSRYESAATIAGFAFNPMTASFIPEITIAIAHLRDVLGDPAYDSFARAGEQMTTAAMANYAYDQIDQARTELAQQGESTGTIEQ